MNMATPFDPMLYNKPITWISVTPESINPATGAVIPEITEAHTLAAVIHETLPVKRNSTMEQSWTSKGVLIEGYRSIHTEQNLHIGDRIEITERNGTISTWKVETLFSTYPTLSKLLEISWYSFAIKLIDPSEQHNDLEVDPIITSPTEIESTATFDLQTSFWTVTTGADATSDSKSLVNQETEVIPENWN